jgi:hypothetical protein
MPGTEHRLVPVGRLVWFDYDTAGLNALLRGREARPAVTAGDRLVML